MNRDRTNATALTNYIPNGLGQHCSMMMMMMSLCGWLFGWLTTHTGSLSHTCMWRAVVVPRRINTNRIKCCIKKGGRVPLRPKATLLFHMTWCSTREVCKNDPLPQPPFPPLLLAYSPERDFNFYRYFIMCISSAVLDRNIITIFSLNICIF